MNTSCHAPREDEKDGRGFWTYAGQGVGVGSSFLLLNAQQYVYIKIGLQAVQRSQRHRRLVRSSMNNFGQAMSTFPSGGSCGHCTPFSMCLMMTFRQCQFLSTRSLDSIALAAHPQGLRHHPSRLHLQRTGTASIAYACVTYVSMFRNPSATYRLPRPASAPHYFAMELAH